MIGRLGRSLGARDEQQIAWLELGDAVYRAAAVDLVEGRARPLHADACVSGLDQDRAVVGIRAGRATSVWLAELREAEGDDFGIGAGVPTGIRYPAVLTVLSPESACVQVRLL